MSDDWLIMKRGLFFRPGACGYTGIRDQAGRFSREVAEAYVKHDAISLMRATDAPEFMPAAFSDLVIKHLTSQRDAMVKALEFIRDGYDNPDVNHVDFRVRAYQVALDALAPADEATTETKQPAPIGAARPEPRRA